LPTWLFEPVIPRILSYPISAGKDDHIFIGSPHGAPNQVLINEYVPGQFIMPHKDGPAFYPTVCTVSLGGSVCLNFFGTKDGGIIDAKPCFKILQEPRSLLITTGELYTDFLHGIEETLEDVNLTPKTVSNWDLLRSTDNIIEGKVERQLRTSLTYRDVLKVAKLGAKFGMFGKR
jgi:alkylated DNA repair protein alkB family protein 6